MSRSSAWAIGSRPEVGSSRNRIFRVVDEGLRDAGALPHSFGVAANIALPGIRLQPYLFKTNLDAAAALRFGDFEQAGVEVEQVPARHGIVKVGLFGQIREVVFDRVIAHRSAEQRSIARRREQQSKQHLDRGRLACPVASEEAENLAFRHVQVQVVDRDHFLLVPHVHVLFGEALDKKSQQP